jgi:hypothetical protein
MFMSRTMEVERCEKERRVDKRVVSPQDGASVHIMIGGEVFENVEMLSWLLKSVR